MGNWLLSRDDLYGHKKSNIKKKKKEKTIKSLKKV